MKQPSKEKKSFSGAHDEEYAASSSRDRGKEGRDAGTGIPGAVAGRNAVRELLKSGRSVDKIYVKQGGREGSIVVIVAEAVNRKIPVIETTQDKLSQMAGGAHHQGVVALAAEKQYTDVEGILRIAKERGEMPLIVIADGIEDPQNLGALIRCAECAGAHGIIIPKRRAVGLTPIVAKASAGAIEHMAVAKVTNLADTIEKLKKEGKTFPKIYASCGTKDPLYEADKQYADYLKELGADVTWDEMEGYGHEWRFWDAQVEKFLDWIPRDDEYAKRGKRSV